MAMAKRSTRNILLVELIIVIVFFAVSAVITLQFFFKANTLNRENTKVTHALLAAQDWTEQLYVAEDPEALLEAAGWVKDDMMYVYYSEDGAFMLASNIQRQPGQAGEMIYMNMSVYERTGDEATLLVTMPISRYDTLAEVGT